MVYEEKTLKLCHELSEEGQVAYDKLLSEEADKMTVNSEHKVLAFFNRLLDCLKISDSLIQRKYHTFLSDLEKDRK